MPGRISGIYTWGLLLEASPMLVGPAKELAKRLEEGNLSEDIQRLADLGTKIYHTDEYSPNEVRELARLGMELGSLGQVVGVLLGVIPPYEGNLQDGVKLLNLREG